MFAIFKKKQQSLISLLPSNYIDIHSHLLPGLDDGAKNMEASVALLKRMQNLGISNFVFTPHVMEGVWENSSELISKRLDEFKAHLKMLGIEVPTLRAAAEYMLDDNFLKLLKQEKLRTIIDSTILVELSYLSAPYNVYETLFEIQLKGYQPLLAHPERYSFYHQNFNEYYKLKEAGCQFQLNLLSLSDYYGKNVQKIAIRLLEEKMIDFVGSDVHHQRHLDALEKINNRKLIELVSPILEKNSLFL